MPPSESDKRRIQDINCHAKTASGITFHPTEIEVKTSRYSKAAKILVKGLTDNGEVPDNLEAMDAVVNGTLIGRGVINSAWKNEEGLVTAEAYDGVRRMKARKFKHNYSNNAEGGENAGEPPRKVAEDIFKKAGVQFEIHTENQFAPRHRQNIPEGALDDLNININFNYHCAEAMKTLCQHSGAVWYFTEENTGIYTYNANNVLHNVEGILRDDSGEQEMPYTKVVVYGSRSNPASGLAAMDIVKGTAGGGNRVYETTVNSIHNDHQAQVLAEEIMLEFRRQQSAGKIKMVGNEHIRPLDGIHIPDYAGGEEYLVGGVTHRINNDDGFITEIDCNGFYGREIRDVRDMNISSNN